MVNFFYLTWSFSQYLELSKQFLSFFSIAFILFVFERACGTGVSSHPTIPNPGP